MIDFAGYELTAEDRAVIQHPAVGGLILFARNFESRAQVKELIADIRSVRQQAELPALLVAVDQEGGRVQRFREDFTRLPPLRWLGHQYDADPVKARQLTLAAARLMASEVLDTGADFSFAPVVDIDWGLCDVIGDRALHENPTVVGELALAYMQGMRQAGMAAIAKHFPGHGGVTGDSHLVLPEDARPYSELVEDMRPYQTMISDALQGVMMAHIRYTQVEAQIASLSAYWMNSVLRQELGFTGAIFSDDLSMKGAEVGGGVAERAVTALQSGADMVLVCNDRESVPPVLEALDGYSNPVAHARLAAMRMNRAHYEQHAYGSEAWQQDLDAVNRAHDARPGFELDGGG